MKTFLLLLLSGGWLMLNAQQPGLDAVPVPAAGPLRIWVAGVDPVVQHDRHTDQPADYMDLFAPNAPWKTGAAGTAVFKVSTQLILRGTDEQVKTVLDGLRARHIALAVELGVLVGSDSCGKGTEGFASPLGVEALCKRLQKLGGVLDYVDMDEPVTWGHEKVGKNKLGIPYCQLPVTEVALQAATKIAILKQYFPNIQIGLIDAISGNYPRLGADIVQFIDLLYKQSGVKVTYFHADVAWQTNWQPQLQLVIQRLRQRRIRTGVVFDGNEDATTDKQWIEQALQHFKVIMGNPALKADDLVFQTWSPRPVKMLPETDPTAWTYAVRFGVMAMNEAGR